MCSPPASPIRCANSSRPPSPMSDDTSNGAAQASKRSAWTRGPVSRWCRSTRLRASLVIGDRLPIYVFRRTPMRPNQGLCRDRMDNLMKAHCKGGECERSAPLKPRTSSANCSTLVEQGEEITITRHGKEVARLVPPRPARNRDQARAALRRMRERGSPALIGALRNTIIRCEVACRRPDRRWDTLALCDTERARG
jgi:prevent-host-death family protein